MWKVGKKWKQGRLVHLDLYKRKREGESRVITSTLICKKEWSAKNWKYGRSRFHQDLKKRKSEKKKGKKVKIWSPRFVKKKRRESERQQKWKGHCPDL